LTDRAVADLSLGRELPVDPAGADRLTRFRDNRFCAPHTLLVAAARALPLFRRGLQVAGVNNGRGLPKIGSG
jgi:hypothetical protein